MPTWKISSRIRTIVVAVGLTLAVNLAISGVIESASVSATKTIPALLTVDSGGVELPKPPRP